MGNEEIVLKRRLLKVQYFEVGQRTEGAVHELDDLGMGYRVVVVVVIVVAVRSFSKSEVDGGERGQVLERRPRSRSSSSCPL